MSEDSKKVGIIGNVPTALWERLCSEGIEIVDIANPEPKVFQFKDYRIDPPPITDIGGFANNRSGRRKRKHNK